MSVLNDTAIFLINVLFDLYLMILGARLILAWSRADYFNPVTRLIIKITQPVIIPLRRFLPTLRGIELSTVFCIIFLQFIKLGILTYLFAVFPGAGILLIGALLASIKLILTLFFYAILIGAIMSFLSPGVTPVSQVLFQLSAPILTPLRRVIPPVGGFDITPIPALIILQVFIRLL